MNKLYKIEHINGYFRIIKSWDYVEWTINDDFSVNVKIKFDSVIYEKKEYEYCFMINRNQLNELKEKIDEYKKKNTKTYIADGQNINIYEYNNGKRTIIAEQEGIDSIKSILNFLYSFLENYFKINYDNNGDYLEPYELL